MDFRQRLEAANTRPADNEPSQEREENMDNEYFATDNIKSLPACLDLRLSSGKRKALPYSYFTEMNFDSETCIEILTSEKKVKITGRNLTKLYDYLVNYRVRFIQANIGNDPKDDGVFVGGIVVEELD